MALLTAEQIIIKRVKIYDDMLSFESQRKKINYKIRECRDELIRLDKMCSLRWKK